MITLIADKNKKLSKFVLQSCSDISYSAFMKLLREKDIKINGKRVSQDCALNVGDRVEIYYIPAKKPKYALIFSDENIIVIDKKSGYTSEEVFVDLQEEYNGTRFIHRLDRNTAGVMIFARNDIAENLLLQGFKKHSFDKKYLAKVYGKMPKEKDILTAFLTKDSTASTVKIFDRKMPNSVEIKTGYKVLSNSGETSLLEVTLYTGKTHQIRAHLAHMGHFIIGDGKYGDNQINKNFKTKSQMLVAHSLMLKFEENSALYYLNGKTFLSKTNVEN